MTRNFRVSRTPGEFEVETLESTNKGNEHPKVEDEIEGKIEFVIQPMLVKLGTGKGERLNKYTIVRRAYIELAKGSDGNVD